MPHVLTTANPLLPIPYLHYVSAQKKAWKENTPSSSELASGRDLGLKDHWGLELNYYF